MSNQPIISPTSGGGGPLVPGAGTVTPATISQTPAPFVFPQDVQVLRNLLSAAGVTLKFVPGSDGAQAFQFCHSDGTPFITIDSNSGRMGFATTTPGKLLDCNGDANVAGTLTIGSILRLPALSQAIINTLTPSLGWTVINTDNSNLPQFWNGSAWKVFTVS